MNFNRYHQILNRIHGLNSNEQNQEHKMITLTFDTTPAKNITQPIENIAVTA